MSSIIIIQRLTVSRLLAPKYHLFGILVCAGIITICCIWCILYRS